MRIQVELTIHPGKIYSVTQKEYTDLYRLGLIKVEQSDVEVEQEPAPKKVVKRKRTYKRKTSPVLPEENPGESLS